MWSYRRADQVKSCFHVGDPVANGLVDGIFQGATATGDRTDFSSQQLHTKDVERLTLHIYFTHVDDTLQAEHSTDGGGGDPMLSRASFSDDALLTHTSG